MKAYSLRSTEELIAEKTELEKKYKEYQEQELHLDMTRGKPSALQLDVSEEMLNTVLKNEDCYAADGTDCRNYGVQNGIPEVRELMGQIAGAPAEQTIVFGSASLNIMFDTISRAFTHGIFGNTPWGRLEKVKFLCPVPGYDRHFGITEHFGVEMINIPMLPTGPDMDMVEELVAKDEAIKGIWCVPKYSNPQGITYSDETVKRFAALKPAAADFRIFWDNAYAIHNLYNEEENQDKLLNIIEECEKAGNPDLVFVFCSTSKVTYAGGGVAAVASSKKNIAEMSNHIKFQTIGSDKMNQLRHIKYLKNMDGVKKQMEKQADMLRPNFEVVYAALKNELTGLDIATWTEPKGGYFVCFEALEGCASKIVKMAKDAGLSLTEAGSVFPYHKDPKDSILRIAPSMPTVDELKVGAALFTLCVKIVSLEKLIADRA